MVQTVSGITHRQAEVVPAKTPGPQFYPVSAIDYCTGYLMAFGAMMARLRQSREGGSWHVKVSLAQTGRWIDVDVTRFVVRLMDGKQVVKEIGPVAVGKQVDTGAYESTQTGLFHVYNKIAPLTFDPPYNTYIQWWVGFDPQKDNGFHSFLLDKDGKVVVKPGQPGQSEIIRRIFTEDEDDLMPPPDSHLKLTAED